MSRVIKFRTWDEEDGEMVFFDLYSVVGLRPEELDASQQFTGLLDKKGKEIYEGDIIEGDDGLHDYVLYSNGEFILIPQDDNCVYWELCNVIGNIHENPELLEDLDVHSKS